MNPTKTFIAATAFLMGGSIAAVTASGAFAADGHLVSEADVVVELDDVNANALTYWPDIEQDLEAKLAEKIEPFYSGEGYEITVSLSEISIDGSALLGHEGEFNTLKGWVYIREQGKPTPVESVGLSLTAKTGEVDPSADIVIAPAKNAFYEALIDRFAERTMEEVQGL